MVAIISYSWLFTHKNDVVIVKLVHLYSIVNSTGVKGLFCENNVAVYVDTQVGTTGCNRMINPIKKWQWNLRQSNLIYPTMNTLKLSLLLELPNKSFWYDHKMTDMPRLPDYLDVFLSPSCEVITSGHCRKIMLPTASQNWWNVDQVAHKLRNLWSIKCFVCLIAHFANNSKGIKEIPLYVG